MNERQNNSPSLEVTLYAALFVTALALRLYHLGAQPLNDQEAREALTALARLRGEATASMPASPAYFFVTLLGFYLMGASEAVARLGPALAGAGLVLAPGLFRGAVGRGAALVMAGLLALASTLLAASRSADGALLALLGLAVGVGGLWRYAHEGGRSWLLGAAGLALGLASGGTFLLGALALVITLVALALTRPASLAVAREVFDPRQPFVRQLLLTVGAISALAVATPSAPWRTPPTIVEKLVCIRTMAASKRSISSLPAA